MAPGACPTRSTKIVATLGPASLRPATITAMIDAGMDVVRLNTSHGVIEQHQRAVALVRECAETRDRPIGVLMDLGGPKLRTGPTEGGRPLNLVSGHIIRLTPDLVDGTEELLTVDYPSLLEDVRPGDPVLLDDGHIELRVESSGDGAVECSVIYGGMLAPNKGVAFPKSNLTMPALTPRDIEAISAGVECGVDLFAMSFVRTADDLEKTRMAINKAGADIPVIAKIERRQAIENLEEIISESDGAMVARGDLGIDLPPEEVPIQQRRIVESAARNKVPVITATQMLESMVSSPRPTRAEASDVANAVWELADAVMLSAETAIGRFPVEAVEMMDRVIRRAESGIPQGSAVAAPHSPDDHSYVIALAARTIVDADPNLRAIVSFTKSGYSAYLMSKAYPGVPIYGVSPDPSVVRRLSLARSVVPVYGDHVSDADALFVAVDNLLMGKGHVSRGDEVLVTGSLPMGVEGTTNFLKLHRVGETTRGGGAR